MEPEVASRTSGEAPANIPVVGIANAVVAFDRRFVEKAAFCLRHVLDEAWTPEVEELEMGRSLPKWDDLPKDAGFKIVRVGGAGSQRRVNASEKQEQCRSYAKYLQWAEVACGVSQQEFEQHLRTAAALGRHSRGVTGLPAWLRRKDLTICAHAVLLCRVAGLRKVATGELPSELEGEAFAANAELERLMALGEPEIQAEQDAVRHGLRGQQGFNFSKSSYDSGAWAVGLFRVWLHAHGAKWMRKSAEWRDLTRAVPTCDLEAPICASRCAREEEQH